MSSRAESLMAEVLARLEGSPAMTLGSNTVTVQRSHRIAVTLDQTPMVHLIGGADTPERSLNDCLTRRQKEFTVSVFVRDDNGASVADPLVLEINRRLDPRATAYSSGADLVQGPIAPEEEIADQDAIRIDMRFAFTYQTQGWTLE